jgi:hypothetical protein
MLSILALGMLVAVGSAIDEPGGFESAPYGGDYQGGDHQGGDHQGNRDFGGHGYNDWLNPGGYSYTYSWSYPSYYSNSWYPAYTYTYPNYYYTAPAPVVYPTYPYYYDPVVYDPWYGANVYGWGGSSYYYSNSWSWYNHGGYFF